MTASENTSFADIQGDEEDVDTTGLDSDQTVVSSLDFGLPSLGLTIDPAITLTASVGSSYNGETLNIYHQLPGDSAWILLGTCVVSGGECSFSVTQL